MKRFNLSKIAAASSIAMVLAFGAASAQAGNSNGNNGNNGTSGSISGSAQASGEGTVGQITSSLGVSSVTQGNAVSATEAFGPNAFSTQSTVSTGNGTATAGINVTPTSINANTSQTASTNVVSHSDQSPQLPTLDTAGLLINGTAGTSQVINNAAAGAAMQITGIAAQGSIEGSIGVSGQGSIPGL